MRKTAVLLLLAAFVVYAMTPALKTPKLPDFVFENINLANIRIIERKSPSEEDVTLFYDLGGAVWRIKELEGYPAYSERIREMLFGIVAMRPIQFKTSNPERYAELDLDPETAREIILRDSKGKEIAHLLVGKRSTEEDDRNAFYIKRADSPETFLAFPAFDVTGKKEQFAMRFLANFSDEQVKAIKVTQSGRQRMLKSKNQTAFLKNLNFETVRRDKKEKGSAEVIFSMHGDFDIVFTLIKLEDEAWVRIETIPVKPELQPAIATLVNALIEKHRGYLYRLPIAKEEALASILKAK